MENIKDTISKIKIMFEKDNPNLFDAIENTNDFDVFKFLAPTRESLLNWYEFRQESSVLIIGDTCGALTGVFLKKFLKVTVVIKDEEEEKIIRNRWKCFSDNLRIVFDSSVINQAKYDYILLLGIEYLTKGGKNITEYSEKLSEIFSILSDKGVLLIAAENRYGIKYFCGEPDPITNIPFAALNRATGHKNGYLLNRKELISAVSGVSGVKYKIYYPIPDYFFPQMIYTDEKLPQTNLKERLLTYSANKDALLMSEKKLYDDIIENNVFPFFSNSFLIECGRDSSRFSDVIYAALSTDRGDEHGFSTTIHNNGIVKKSALSENGIRSLKLMTDNINDIHNHGINVVNHKLCKNYIEMSDMHYPTLSEYMKKMLKIKSQKFITLFDDLYSEILKSSEETELVNSECYEINISSDYWGPVLKRAYIDMVPVNCFYADGDLIFFDQEFVIENFPARYIIFRAIKYTYSSMPFAEEIFPIKILKEHFKLNETWAYFNDRERIFINNNRNKKIYKTFWKLTELDNKIIASNGKKLLI